MRLLRILAAFIFLCLIVILGFLPPYLIKIHSITCETQFGQCDEFLLGKLQSISNKSLIDSKSAIKKILASEVLVENYTFQYNFPDKLKLNVLLRKPTFALKDNSSNGFFLIDESGVVVSKVPLTNLLFIEDISENPKITAKIKQTSLFALLTLNELFYFYGTKSGKVEDQKLTVSLSEGPIAIFPLEGDRKVLVGSLRLILSRLREAQEEPRIDSVKEIDLRFKNPVLR